MTLNIFSKFALKQAGGGRNTFTTFLTLMLISLSILFIKAMLVHWSYNEVIPNLFNEKYRKITIVEALFLIILFSSLLN